MRFDAKALLAALSVTAASALATTAIAQHAGHGAPAPRSVPPTKPSPPISMEELHRHGGVPRGWKFALPGGDPKAGRELFARLECAKCHEIKPDFPRGERSAGDVGPELTGMGDHHPAEYFAQSIVDPNAVIVAGPGFVGPDGRSVMPDYRDSLTVNELVDLVAYLKSLRGDAHAHHHGAAVAREQTSGPYRVRLAYDRGGHGAHAHHGGGTAQAAGHLMAFVTDATSGEPVPYLPVSIAIATGQTPPRTLRLVPMLGDDGFHYGADVTIPSGTTKITVTVGGATVKTSGAAAGRFQKRVTLSFDWSE